MTQHIIVSIIFAACLYLVVRRIARYISQAKKGDAQCSTCTEISCPLHHSTQSKKRNQRGTISRKMTNIAKNCKKT